MKIFSKHRRKLEPQRRFGTRDFQSKVQKAQNYKRVFRAPASGWLEKFWRRIGLGSKWWRRLGLLAVAVILYFLIISPEFVITEYQISGNSQVSTQSILDVLRHAGESRWFLIKEADYFLMTRGRVNALLTSQLPTIKEITNYRRIWPRGAAITVKERTPGFVIKSSDKYFLIDEDGVVVKHLDAPGDLIVAEDSVVEDFGTGETLPNHKMAPFIVSMVRAWPGKISVGLSGVVFPGKSADVIQFNSAEGWSVSFDLDRPVNSQLANLNLLLTKQIPAGERPNLAYIDLRSSKWAYYCFKGAACQQQPAQEDQAAGETETPIPTPTPTPTPIR